MRYLLPALPIVFLVALIFIVSREPARDVALNEALHELETIEEQLAEATLREQVVSNSENESMVSRENMVIPEKKESETVSRDTNATENSPAATDSDAVSRETMLERLQELQNTVDTLTYREPEPYIELVNPSGFVNSEPFTLSEFVGEKVVLLKFTTYSCINCQRTYPFVTDWYDKYQDQGLEIVAVHTPEFSFERKIENVEEAMATHGITFPVVLDNDYATWRAYSNNFWPRLYLIDIHGNIVYDHIGEGAYNVTEAKIKKILAEREEFLAQ